MIPKQNRLLTKKDFSLPLSKGRVFHGQGLSLKLVSNGKDYNRIGLIISTKISKRAVRRNKIRRRLRSIIGSFLPQLEKGWDVVVLTRKEVLEMSFAEVKQSTEYVFKKAGLLGNGRDSKN